MSKALAIPADTIDRALEMIAEGRSLIQVSSELGVKRSTLYDAFKRDGVLDRYETARQMAADALAEELVEIADSEPDPQRAKVRCDQRRWLASKYLPSRYGEKLDLSITQRVDLQGALAEARARVGLVRVAGEVIDVQDAEIVERDAGDNIVPPDIFN